MQAYLVPLLYRDHEKPKPPENEGQNQSYYGLQQQPTHGSGPSNNHYAMPAPIKTYNLVNNHKFSSQKLELQQNGQTILWVNNKINSIMGPQEIRIHQGGESGPILATSRLRSSTAGCRVYLGGPDSAPKSEWCSVEGKGKEFVFHFAGRTFTWRTKDEAANLVDVSHNGYQTLATYEGLKKTFSRQNVAKFDFMVELGRDLELLAMAAILAIAELVQWPNGLAGSQAAGMMGGGGGC